MKVWTILVIAALFTIVFYPIYKGSMFGAKRIEHEYVREVKQDDRTDKLASRDASAVGEKVDEVPKIQVILKPHGCWAILSASIDLDEKTDDGHVLLRNRCAYAVDYYSIDFKLKAADGTTIGSGIWENSFSNHPSGEKIDARGSFNGRLDPRTTTIIVTTRED